MYQTRRRSFGFAVTALLSALLLIISAPLARAQGTAWGTYEITWGYSQHDPLVGLCALTCKAKTITIPTASLTPALGSDLRLVGYRPGPQEKPAPPAAKQKHGDGKPNLTGIAQAKARKPYDPVAAKKKAAAAAKAAGVTPAPVAPGGSLRGSVTAAIQQPMDTGEQVTPGSAVITFDADALAALGASGDYVNEDGKWNANPFAASPTAPAPPGYPDIPTPAGFVAGTRGRGTNGAPTAGYKYYFDYATMHVSGTWAAGSPWYGSGTIDIGGPRNTNLCELSHSTTASALGSIENHCVCNCSGIAWATVEMRRKKIGVAGAKTNRFIINTSRKPWGYLIGAAAAPYVGEFPTFNGHIYADMMSPASTP